MATNRLNGHANGHSKPLLFDGSGVPVRYIVGTNGHSHPQPQAWSGAWGSPYDSANYSQNRGWVPGNSIDFKSELDDATHAEIVRKSRYLHKNSGFSREVALDMQLYSVFTGIGLQSICDDVEMRTVYEEYFRQWSVRCEVTGRFSFAEFQGLVCQAIDRDGEVFVIKRRDKYGRAKLQLVETHRLQPPPRNGTTNEQIPAIETDEDGAVAWYHFRQDDGKDARVPANAVMHIFEPESASALRTAPPGQHSINHLLDESELLAFEKIAAKDAAGISRVVTNERGEVPQDELIPFGSQNDPPTDPRTLQAIIGGKIVALKPGEKMEQYQSDRPSPTFTGFLKHLRRDSALGQLPVEFVEDSSSVGGAGVRLVVGKAGRKFNYRSFILFTRLLVGTWSFVIGDAIDNPQGPQLRPVKNWNRIQPQNPQDVTVDAGYSEAADLAAVAAGVMTLEEYFARRNKDFEEEIQVRVNNAKTILTACGQPSAPVPLWMIYAPPGSASAFAAMQAAAEEPPAAGNGDEEDSNRNEQNSRA